MRGPLTVGLAMLAAGCSSVQSSMEPSPRAPAGWQPFCFVAPVGFLAGTDDVTPGTERLLAIFYEAHLKEHSWLHLRVYGGGAGEGRTALTNRRVQSALRLLGRLGVPRDRIVVVDDDAGLQRWDRDVGTAGSSVPDGPVSLDIAASVSAMIPPEEVERHRIDFEERGIVVC